MWTLDSMIAVVKLELHAANEHYTLKNTQDKMLSYYLFTVGQNQHGSHSGSE